MNRATVYTPVDQDFLICPTGALAAHLEGRPGFVNVGDVATASSNFESESEDIFTHQTAVRTKVGKRVMSSTLSGSFEMQQLTPAFWAVSHMSDPTLTFAQEAAANQTLVIPKMKPGLIFPTSHKMISAPTLRTKDIAEEDVVLELGEHFQIDDIGGSFEVLAFPDNVAVGADGYAPGVAGYSAATIVAVQAVGPGSKLEVRGSLRYRGMNAKGIKELVELWNVAFTVSTERTWVSNSADLGTITIDWEAFPDPTKPAAFAFGQVLNLSDLERAA